MDWIEGVNLLIERRDGETGPIQAFVKLIASPSQGSNIISCRHRSNSHRKSEKNSFPLWQLSLPISAQPHLCRERKPTDFKS